MSDHTAPAVCPFTGRAAGIPLDGNPHRPTPAIATARAEAPAVPVQFADGHDGLLEEQQLEWRHKTGKWLPDGSRKKV